MSKTSLRYFRLVKEGTGSSSYLFSRSSFKNIQLKFKFRCGVIGLGENLHRKIRESGLCKMCGCYETLKHFLFYCPAYTDIRLILYDQLRFSCTDIFNLFLNDLDFATCILLGGHDDILNSYALSYISGAWSRREKAVTWFLRISFLVMLL